MRDARAARRACKPRTTWIQSGAATHVGKGRDPTFSSPLIYWFKAPDLGGPRALLAAISSSASSTTAWPWTRRKVPPKGDSCMQASSGESSGRGSTTRRARGRARPPRGRGVGLGRCARPRDGGGGDVRRGRASPRRDRPPARGALGWCASEQAPRAGPRRAARRRDRRDGEGGAGERRRPRARPSVGRCARADRARERGGRSPGGARARGRTGDHGARPRRLRDPKDRPRGPRRDARLPRGHGVRRSRGPRPVVDRARPAKARFEERAEPSISFGAHAPRDRRPPGSMEGPPRPCAPPRGRTLPSLPPPCPRARRSSRVAIPRGAQPARPPRPHFGSALAPASLSSHVCSLHSPDHLREMGSAQRLQMA